MQSGVSLRTQSGVSFRRRYACTAAVVFSSVSPSTPFTVDKLLNNCAASSESRKEGGHIYSFYFFYFYKNTLPIKRKNIVLSCECPLFGIYYIINQTFIHCTIFVQNRTFRTFWYKMPLCTQTEKPYNKSTAFVRALYPDNQCIIRTHQ